MLVVLDTNILVSALLSPNGRPAEILNLALNQKVRLCYDSRILTEYEAVLSRPKFSFEPGDVGKLMSFIQTEGMSVIPTPLTIPFVDQSDAKFYETAKHCHAALITGNQKHFPEDKETVFTAAEYLEKFMGRRLG